MTNDERKSKFEIQMRQSTFAAVRLRGEVGDIEAAVGVDAVLGMELGGQMVVEREELGERAELAAGGDVNAVDKIGFQAAAAPNDARLGRGAANDGFPLEL